MGTQELQTTAGQPPAIRIADAVATIKTNVQMVQHVMREIMKPEVHYGVVPGTQKPSLLQPGAEVICLAFHWSTRYTTEDLSYADVARYRITCDIHNRDTGEFMGSGQGEASSDEEKYRWRKAVCPQEFEAAPPDRKRTKWAKGKGGTVYTIDQVRQEPADIANTVLKMANKRAHIAAVRTASGCSDMFAQDLEDLPAEVRDSMTQDESKPEPQPIGDRDWKKLLRQAEKFGYEESDVLHTAAVLNYEGTGPEMPDDVAQRIYQALKANPKNLAPSQPAVSADPETGEVIDAGCGDGSQTSGFHTPMMGG